MTIGTYSKSDVHGANETYLNRQCNDLMFGGRLVGLKNEEVYRYPIADTVQSTRNSNQES